MHIGAGLDCVSCYGILFSMKPKFVLPKTAKCIVRYVDKEGATREVGLTTPLNNEGLFTIMLSRYQIGFSQIRTVKADPNSALTQAPGRFTIDSFGRNS